MCALHYLRTPEVTPHGNRADFLSCIQILHWCESLTLDPFVALTSWVACSYQFFSRWWNWVLCTLSLVPSTLPEVPFLEHWRPEPMTLLPLICFPLIWKPTQTKTFLSFITIQNKVRPLWTHSRHSLSIDWLKWTHETRSLKLGQSLNMGAFRNVDKVKSYSPYREKLLIAEFQPPLLTRPKVKFQGLCSPRRP
jgi:hypothetical protein